ncbi:MAG: transposase [Bdellovibrionales bacterium]|nr:transposase [Bdellovibrionales bacterium]
MGNVPIPFRTRKQRKPLKHAKRKDVLENKFEDEIEVPIDTQHLLISMLLPPAVKAFMEECEREVDRLCGARYEHGKTNSRWGTQKGSIVLGNQNVAIEKPRVRGKSGNEIKIQTYEDFQDPRLFDQAVFTEGIKRVSQRDYQKGVSKIASSFGFKKSKISKRWINATAKKIEQLQNRDLKPMDIRAVLIDGKRFRKHGVIIAMGIANDGRKFVLGIYQADTENSSSCIELLTALEKRGLPSSGLLFIVDGGSGLNKALNDKYQCHDRKRRRAIRIRCHVHKWRNIEKALGDDSHKASALFWALREAKDMGEAKVLSDRLESVLRSLNRSALDSYLEAKDDILAVHEFKMSKDLKRFFSTTNAIESLNSLIEEDMRRVKRWRDSEHFQRWLATYCLASEKKMRRVRGHKALPGLWTLLRSATEIREEVDSIEAVA